MLVMTFIKIDNDYVILKDVNGTLQWADISALKCNNLSRGDIVNVTIYENLYSRQIETITKH